MVPPKSKSRIIHSRCSTEELQFTANGYLTTGRPTDAVRQYTKILQKTSPGYIPAFLNRSLGYIALGYPELAVADAYRAAQLLHEVQSGKYRFGAREKRTVALKNFMAAEKLHRSSYAPWVSAPGCYVGEGWLELPLAAVSLANSINYTNPKTYATRLEACAIYRLCGALWRCGGGARSDAIGLIEDALRSNERKIQRFLLREVKDIKRLADFLFADLAEDTEKMSNDENRIKHQLLMKSKYTSIEISDYPWAAYEKFPAKSRRALVNHLQETTPMITASELSQPQLVAQNNTAGTDWGLVASRAINSSDTVLLEDSTLQVTTSSPSDEALIYCEGCAVLMVLPEGCYVDRPDQGLRKEDKHNAQLLDLCAPTEKNTSNGGSDDDGLLPDVPIRNTTDAFWYNPLRSRVYSENPPTPPPHEKVKPAPHYYFCTTCRTGPFCSTTCFLQNAEHHAILCATGVEDDIRVSYNSLAAKNSIQDISKSNIEQFVHPKAQMLYDLILVRVLATAAHGNIHPLDLNEMRWSFQDLFQSKGTVRDSSPELQYVTPPNSNPTQQSAVSTKALPWSFTTHVVRPIDYLLEMGLDPIIDLEKWDAWVVNTLFAKIMHSTRISKGARHVKSYDCDGQLLPGLARNLLSSKRFEDIVDRGQDIWVGTLHPIFSMIPVADPEKGEKPNIRFQESGVIKCLPVLPLNQGVIGEATFTTATVANDNGRQSSPELPLIRDTEQVDIIKAESMDSDLSSELPLPSLRDTSEQDRLSKFEGPDFSMLRSIHDSDFDSNCPPTDPLTSPKPPPTTPPPPTICIEAGERILRGEDSESMLLIEEHRYKDEMKMVDEWLGDMSDELEEGLILESVEKDGEDVDCKGEGEGETKREIKEEWDDNEDRAMDLGE
ncbi:hypothetical protein MMC09_006930 [Bachmanniomyces sp. S44760]|nr:hypothetical protein [Bachmanniomyces sp. S44760]